MVRMVRRQEMYSSLFTTTIQIFLFLWNMMCEAELGAPVDSTANLGMAVLGGKVVHQLPGKSMSLPRLYC
jgi:hypothetical protein